MSTQFSPTSPGWSCRCFALSAYLLACIGQAAFLAMVICLGQGWEFPVRPFDLGAWWWPNLLWLAAFATQHSGMARNSFQQCLERWFPRSSLRSLYVALSGLLLLALPFLWQPLPGGPWWSGPWWIQTISWLGALGVAGIMLLYNHLEFFGLRQAWTGPLEDRPPVLHTRGPYRLVRHPLMLCTLVFLWGHPVMTPTLAMLSGGLSVYIVAGILLEERDLARRFGGAYQEYQKQTPMLAPWKFNLDPPLPSQANEEPK